MSENFLKSKSLGSIMKVELDLLTMQKKQNLKMQQVFIHRISLKKLI